MCYLVRMNPLVVNLGMKKDSSKRRAFFCVKKAPPAIGGLEGLRGAIINHLNTSIYVLVYVVNKKREGFPSPPPKSRFFLDKTSRIGHNETLLFLCGFGIEYEMMYDGTSYDTSFSAASFAIASAAPISITQAPD